MQVGGSYSAIIDIARQATKDLGFKIEMQNVDGDALVNRVATQPESVDIADIEYWAVQKSAPRGVLQAIDLQKFKYWDKVVPIFTKGKYPDGRKVSRQGTLPYEVQYLAAPTPRASPTGRPTARPASRRSTTPTPWASGPTWSTARSSSWNELLNPEFKGKTAILDVPLDRHHGRRHGASKSRGDIKYGDKGNMTKEEIDKTIESSSSSRRPASSAPSGRPSTSR